MHFAGVCTEPDARQAVAMSNVGISPSAATVICEPRMPTHAEIRTTYFIGHPQANWRAFMNRPIRKRIDADQQAGPILFMSAFGRKQTFALQKGISALPLKVGVAVPI